MRYQNFFYYFCYLLLGYLLAGCAPHHPADGPPHYYVDVSKIPDAVPRKLPRGAYGNPHVYAIEGRRYHVLNSSYGYFKRGVASWYGTKFHGRLTASREPYDVYGMTAASTDLPIPSFVRVTNLKNHRSCVVKVNDRGPFASNRIIDLSYAAAVKLGYANQGTAPVIVQAINVSDEITTHLSHTAHQYLQLGAFRNFHHAAYLKIHIATLVHKPVVILKGLYHQKIPLYRVLVGPCLGIQELNRLQGQLRKLGFSQLVMVAS